MIGATGGALAQAAVPTQEQTRNFSIPAGPLTGALNKFAAQSGLQILFDASLANGRTTSGVSGAKTPNQALMVLLSGTGVVFRYTGPTTVTLDGPASNAAGATIEGAIALDTIDVSGGSGSAADQPYQTPGSSAYISGEQLQRFPATSTGDIFKSTPGVISAGNRNGVALNVNIRGLQGANRVNVMVDGTQQTTSSYRGYGGHDNRVYVDPELLAGVSIDKGPSGGPYGAGAMGGVVNLRTLEAGDVLKEGATTGLRVHGTLGSNSVEAPALNTATTRTDQPSVFAFGNNSGSVAGAAATENVEVVAAYARRKSGNYFTGSHGPTTASISGTTVSLSPYKYGEEVFNTSVDTESALVKSRLRFAEGHALELGYIYFDSYYGEAWPDLIRFGTKQEARHAHTRTNTYTSRYTYKPADNPFVDLHVSAWASNSDTQLPPIATMVDSVTKGSEIWNASRLSTPLGELSLQYGLSYAQEDGNSREGTGSSSMEGTRAMSSAFNEATLDITSWLRVGGTVRYDYYNIDGSGDASLNSTGDSKPFGSNGDRVSPTASVTLTPWEGVQFYGLYANGWRPPTLREVVGVTAYITPNPNLQPETASNYELGFNVARSTVFTGDDKLRTKVSYFDNDYSNYVIRALSSLNGVTGTSYTWANIPQAHFKGVESQLSYDAGFLFGEASLTYYTDAVYCFSDTAAAASCRSQTTTYDYGSSFVPPKYSGSLTLGARFFDEALTVGTRLSFAGKRAAEAELWATTVPYLWAPYTIVDLFTSYKFTPDMSLNLSIENVGDRYYVDALGNSYMPAPGRTFFTSLSAKF